MSINKDFDPDVSFYTWPQKINIDLNFSTLLRVLLRGESTPKHNANEPVIKVLICIWQQGLVHLGLEPGPTMILHHIGEKR